MHGQSCFALKPRSGTGAADAKFYVADINSYYNQATLISTTKLIETMEKKNIAVSAATCPTFRGFGNIWKCTKDGTGTGDDTPLVALNGYYIVQCDRFLPEATPEKINA